MTCTGETARPPDLALADWADLMRAVTARLGRVADALPSEARSPLPGLAGESLQAQLLDIQAALQQLQHSAAHTIERALR
jgi:hypothetical protein